MTHQRNVLAIFALLVIFTVLLLLLSILFSMSPPAAAAQVPPRWEPQVAIVWPHDGQGKKMAVEQAPFVNVAIWPRNAVSCTGGGDPVLFMAEGQKPYTPGYQSDMILRNVDGVTFPVEVYNNIPVEPGVPYRFWAGLDSPVWVHAADGRTHYPTPIVPAGHRDPTTLTEVSPAAKLQIVWPHDGQGKQAPVESAPLVNLAVDSLLPLDEPLSVPPEYEADLTLYVARGNEPLQPTEHTAEKTFYEANGQRFPRWMFNDVPVRPGEQYHFVAHAEGGVTSVPWTHAADPRTVLPSPQLPPPCIP